MNITRKNILLYVMTVALPFILFISGFIIYIEKKVSKESLEKIYENGTLHQHYLDQFIGETSNNMTLMAYVFAEDQLEQENIKSIFYKTKNSDHRYGNFFLLDSNGVVVTGTREDRKHIQLLSIEDSKTIKETKHSLVLEQRVWNDKNQTFISIVSPIIDKSGEVKGFIMGRIRLEYVENIMEMLTPDYKIKVLDRPTMKGLPKDELSTNNIARIPLQNAPWTIELRLKQTLDYINDTHLTYLIFSALIILHVFYLSLKYYLLKKESAQQRVQYERQKLEAVGTLAASTAHEIKNPLTGVKGLIQLLSEKYKDQEDQMYFDVIQKEISRINEIVNEFMILGRPTVQKLERINITEALGELHPIILAEASIYQIQVIQTECQEPVFVLSQKDQVKQVVLNIVKNAFQASRAGGRVEIRMFPKNDFIVIQISDQGIGMDDYTLKQIFEPFFTSKKDGTGLGLFICQKMIEQFNGRIEVFSEKNVGTTVQIHLPFIV